MDNLTRDQLKEVYLGYIDCINNRRFGELDKYLCEDVSRNGELLGLSGYIAMLENDYVMIPDLYFKVDLLVFESPYVVSRIHFQCSPIDGFLGFKFSGNQAEFFENVIYQFKGGRISNVMSAIDTSLLAAKFQLTEHSNSPGRM
ncbi:MAG: hypothetical protein RL143_509 [Pseudomonadota bacterium]